MKRIFSLALLLILASCQKEEKKVIDRSKADWDSYELLGNVESISEKSYALNGSEKGEHKREVKYSHDFDLVFNDEGKLVVERKWIKGDTPYEESIYEGKDKLISTTQYMAGKPFIKTDYTWENGNNTNIIKRNADGTQLSRILQRFDGDKVVDVTKYNAQDILQDRTAFIYDENGNVKEEDSYLKTESIQFKNIYEYDENGNVTSISRYNKDGGIEYITNSKYDGDKLISKETIDGDKKLGRVQKFTYDNKGNLIIECLKDGDEGIEHVTEYHYDNNGNKLGMVVKQDGNIVYKAGYSYDDHNSMTEFNVADDKNAVKDSKFYRYEYDDKGNWTKKTISINGVETFVVERIITYLP